MMSYEMFSDIIQWFSSNKDQFENFKMEKIANEKTGKLEITITTQLPLPIFNFKLSKNWKGIGINEPPCFVNYPPANKIANNICKFNPLLQSKKTSINLKDSCMFESEKAIKLYVFLKSLTSNNKTCTLYGPYNIIKLLE